MELQSRRSAHDKQSGAIDSSCANVRKLQRCTVGELQSGMGVKCRAMVLFAVTFRTGGKVDLRQMLGARSLTTAQSGTGVQLCLHETL